MEDSSGSALFKYLELGGAIPDVLLLDLHLPDMDGMLITEKLRNISPETPKIIILSAHSAERYATHLIDLGANSFISKDCEPSEVLKAIEEVAEKGYYFNEIVQNSIRIQKKSAKKNNGFQGRYSDR